MLSSTYAKQKSENQEMLKIILSSIRYLAIQGIALCGRYKAPDCSGIGGEVDSNFVQLLKTRDEDNPKLLMWMEKSRDKFMSHDIQNEIFPIMSPYIQREIANAVSGQWFTIMVNETTDLSNAEQMFFSPLC